MKKKTLKAMRFAYAVMTLLLPVNCKHMAYMFTLTAFACVAGLVFNEPRNINLTICRFYI